MRGSKLSYGLMVWGGVSLLSRVVMSVPLLAKNVSQGQKRSAGLTEEGAGKKRQKMNDGSYLQADAKEKTRAEKLADLRAGRSTNRYYAGDRKLEAEKLAKTYNSSLAEEELQRVTPQPLTPEEKEAISRKHGIRPENIGHYGNYKPTEAELNAKLKAWAQQRERRGESLSDKLKALETKEPAKVNQQTPGARRFHQSARLRWRLLDKKLKDKPFKCAA